MMDFLLQIGLSNLCIALVLAIVAITVESMFKRAQLTHLLWLLVFVKLVTPTIVTIPIVTIPGPTDSAAVAIPDHSPLGMDGQGVGMAPQIGEIESDVPGSTETWAVILEQSKVVLSLTWLLGSGAVFAWSLVRVYRFDRLLRRESEVAPKELQAVAARFSSRLRLKAVPTIYTTSAQLSPLVWWIGGRVRIVIPRALLDHMGTQQSQWILAHELAHVRRRDYLVRWLEWLACVCILVDSPDLVGATSLACQ